MRCGIDSGALLRHLLANLAFVGLDDFAQLLSMLVQGVLDLSLVVTSTAALRAVDPAPEGTDAAFHPEGTT